MSELMVDNSHVIWIFDQIKELSPEGRGELLELLRHAPWCKACERNDPRCQCENDE